MMRGVMLRYAIPVCAWGLLTSCVGVTTDARYPEDLRSPNPVARTRATREFARRLDPERAPEGFRLLEDPEAQVRLLAWTALRTMTPDGNDHGYRPHLEPDVRAGTAARWRAAWERRAADAAGRSPGG